jgi:hypothetical protein
MSEYKVSWEININANSPLNAAKEALIIMQDTGSIANQFYIQDEETEDIFSVDLDEEDENAVLPVDNYEPFIVNKK